MLKGTLDDFTLPDIIRFLATAGKTGCIEVTGASGDGRVFLRGGDVYYGESSRTRGLDREPSPEAIKAQIEDTVFDLMRWDMTEFDFSSGVEVQPGAAIDLNVEALIEETARKLEELEVISSKIPSETSVLAMAPNPPENGEINISPDEWRVLVLVSGTRTVSDIADSVGRDSFSVMRTLYGLASHGLIEVVEPPTATELSPEMVIEQTEAVVEDDPVTEADAPDAGTDAYIESLASPLDGAELAERMDEEFPPFQIEASEEEELVFDPGSSPPGDDARPLAAADDTEAAEASGHGEGTGSGSGVLSDLEGAEAEAEPTEIPIEESTFEPEGLVDRQAAVKELADLFERTDDGAAGPPYPAELAARRAAAIDGDDGGDGDGRRRVEDDEAITRGLISRLIDGVKGL